MNAETSRGNGELADALKQLLTQLSDGPTVTPVPAPAVMNQPTTSSAPDGWIRVIAPGTKALLTTTGGTEEVTVLDHFYTPSGLQYHLRHFSPTVRWMVQGAALELINGVTVTQLYNVMTGELQQAA